MAVLLEWDPSRTKPMSSEFQKPPLWQKLDFLFFKASAVRNTKMILSKLESKEQSFEMLPTRDVNKDNTL